MDRIPDWVWKRLAPIIVAAVLSYFGFDAKQEASEANQRLARLERIQEAILGILMDHHPPDHPHGPENEDGQP